MSTATLNRRLAAAMLAVAVAAAACSSSVSGPTETPTTTTTTVGTSPTTTTVVGEAAPVGDKIEPAGSVEGGSVVKAYLAEDYPPELGGIIGAMAADLALSTGVGPDDVAVVFVEEVAWSDASLGCPRPGMSYAQVVTDGMRVILEANGNFYDYRGGGEADWFACIQTPVTDKSTAGIYELTEDGVVQIEPPTYGESEPTEGNNPPDE